jgi:hypothetical protein
MRVKVVAVTLALSLPSFLWPPKPARAATADFAPTLCETRSSAVDFAKSRSVQAAAIF